MMVIEMFCSGTADVVVYGVMRFVHGRMPGERDVDGELEVKDRNGWNP